VYTTDDVACTAEEVAAPVKFVIDTPIRSVVVAKAELTINPAAIDSAPLE
jgi:hypothetical protein